MARDLRLPSRWRLERRLGSGGQGDVWLAFDRELEQRVAVKILPGDLGATGMARVRREVGIGRQLEHPHLIRIHELIEFGDIRAIVMEHMPGGSLAAEVKQGPLAVDRVLDIADQVLGVLTYLHEMNIVHRDVKPSNLLLDERGSVRLGDLGLIRPLTCSDGITKTTAAVGTVAYMSPEQMMAEKITPAADLYSLGATLYTLVAGSQPFAGQSDLQLMAARLNHDPPSPHTLRKECPRWFSRFIMRLMEKAPNDRWANGEKALEAFRKQKGLASPRMWRRRLVLCSLAISLGLTAWTIVDRQRSRPINAHLVGNDLVVFDDDDRELWRRSYERPPRSYVVSDVVGNRQPEVVASKEWTSTDGLMFSEIEVLSKSGHILASFPALNSEARWSPLRDISRGAMLPRIDALDADGDGRDELTWIVQHPTWSASALGIWGPRDDPSPKIIFWNSGHLKGVTSEDINRDGSPELVTWGWNNAMGSQLAVAVLRLSWTSWAASPDNLIEWSNRTDQARLSSIVGYAPLGPMPTVRTSFRKANQGFSLKAGESLYVLDEVGMPSALASMDSIQFWENLARTATDVELGRVAAGSDAQAYFDHHSTILKDDGFHLAATLILGRSIARSGEPGPAAEFLASAGSRHPDSLSLCIKSAELNVIASQFDVARTQLMEVLRTPGAGGPNTLEALTQLIVLDCLTGNTPAFWDSLETALSGTVVNHSGVDKEGKIDRDATAALAFFVGSWQHPSLDVQATMPAFRWVSVLRAWAEMRRTGDENHALEQALVLAQNPELESLAGLFQAAALLDLGHVERALALVDRTLSVLRPQSHDNLLNYAWLQLAEGLKARCLVVVGRTAEADEYLARVNQKAPGAWFAKR